MKYRPLKTISWTYWSGTIFVNEKGQTMRQCIYHLSTVICTTSILVSSHLVCVRLGSDFCSFVGGGDKSDDVLDWARLYMKPTDEKNKTKTRRSESSLIITIRLVFQTTKLYCTVCILYHCTHGFLMITQ